MSPTIYITGNPARTRPVHARLRPGARQLTAVSPYTGETDQLGVALADPVGMQALHMVTADPQRTPTLALFADPDYFFFAGGAELHAPCVTVPTTPRDITFAWNHGGIQPEIATTWLGIVGPGVQERRRRDLGGPHRRPADDAEPARPQGHVCPRRSRADRPARRLGGAVAARSPRDAARLGEVTSS